MSPNRLKKCDALSAEHNLVAIVNVVGFLNILISKSIKEDLTHQRMYFVDIMTYAKDIRVQGFTSKLRWSKIWHEV